MTLIRYLRMKWTVSSTVTVQLNHNCLLTVTCKYYRDVLLTQELLPLPAIYSTAGDVFVFQQDNAPAHGARNTVELLRCETPQFISPNMMQKRVHQVPIRDRHKLRQWLAEIWAEFQHSEVDDAIASSKKTGGHFEHLLWRCLPDIQVATQDNQLFSQPSVPHNTTRLFKATSVWRETIYLPSVERVLHFTR